MSLIIGIDPGPEKSGVVMLDGSSIWSAEHISNSDVLDFIMHTEFALEYPEARGGGVPVSQGIIDTAYWCGRFNHDDGGARYHPREIRIHFCGVASCNRSHVTRAIKDRYGEVGTKKNPGPLYLVGGPHKSENGESITPHLWDALAVALMHYELMQKGK